MQTIKKQTLRDFLSTIVPEQWTASTRDENEEEIFFTAQQFLDIMPPMEKGPLDWDYSIQANVNKTVYRLSRYDHIDNAAAYCVLYFTGKPTPQEYAEVYDFPHETKAYARKTALVIEAITMDTENDYRTLLHYCTEYILPCHWQKRSGAPTAWNTNECIEFCHDFITSWIDTYSAASVRRMRALATEPKKQFITF